MPQLHLTNASHAPAGQFTLDSCDTPSRLTLISLTILAVEAMRAATLQQCNDIAQGKKRTWCAGSSSGNTVMNTVISVLYNVCHLTFSSQ